MRLFAVDSEPTNEQLDAMEAEGVTGVTYSFEIKAEDIHTALKKAGQFAGETFEVYCIKEIIPQE